MALTVGDIATAIENLRPGAEYAIHGRALADLEWVDQVQTRPTDSEIETEGAAVASARGANLYQLQRAEECRARGATPDALIEALWKSVVEGDSSDQVALQTIRQQVDNEFPDPASP